MTLLTNLLGLSKNNPSVNTFPADVPAIKPVVASAPERDTTCLSPIVGIAAPALINSNGAFIRMAELKPTYLGCGNEMLEERLWSFISAIGKLPELTRIQLTSLPQPYDFTSDLEYFIRRGKSFVEVSKSEPGLSDTLRNRYMKMGVASAAMAGSLATFFDTYNPRQQTLLLTVDLDPSSGLRKGAFLNANGTVNRSQLNMVLSQARMVNQRLSETYELVLATFRSCGIDFQDLAPGEMCRRIWMTMNPFAAGSSTSSASQLADNLVDEIPHQNIVPAAEEFEQARTPDDLVSLLVPNEWIQEPDSIKTGNAYVSGYVVYDYTSNEEVLMNSLLQLPGNILSTLYLEVPERGEIVDDLSKRETQLKGSQLTRDRMGQVRDPQLDQETGLVEQTRKDAATATRSPIFVRFYIQRVAKDLETLAIYNQEVERALRVMRTRFYQVQHLDLPKHWNAMLPCSLNSLSQKMRNMTAEALGPFFWPANVRLHEIERGYYYGIDRDSGTPIFYDPFGSANERNPSRMILGKPGSGKSVAIRTHITAQQLGGARNFLFDIEGEHREFCQAFGGRYLEIGAPDGPSLNPLNAPPDSQQPMTDIVSQFLSFYDIITNSDDPLKPGPKQNKLVEAYQMVLEHRGWLKKEPGTGVLIPALAPHEYRNEDAPLLSDVVDVLNNLGSIGASLATEFEQFTSPNGLYTRYANRPTSFDIRNENLVVFGFKHLATSENDILLNLALWSTFQVTWSEIMRSNAANPDVDHFVDIDEGWSFLKIKTASDAIEKLGRRLRKRRGSLGISTQMIREFLDSPVGRRILGIMSTKILLGQESVEAKELQHVFGFSNAILHEIIGGEMGRGVALFPNGMAKRIHIDSPLEWGTILKKKQYGAVE